MTWSEWAEWARESLVWLALGVPAGAVIRMFLVRRPGHHNPRSHR